MESMLKLLLLGIAAFALPCAIGKVFLEEKFDGELMSITRDSRNT